MSALQTLASGAGGASRAGRVKRNPPHPPDQPHLPDQPYLPDLPHLSPCQSFPHTIEHDGLGRCRGRLRNRARRRCARQAYPAPGGGSGGLRRLCDSGHRQRHIASLALGRAVHACGFAARRVLVVGILLSRSAAVARSFSPALRLATDGPCRAEGLVAAKPAMGTRGARSELRRRLRRRWNRRDRRGAAWRGRGHWLLEPRPQRRAGVLRRAAVATVAPAARARDRQRVRRASCHDAKAECRDSRPGQRAGQHDSERACGGGSGRGAGGAAAQRRDWWGAAGGQRRDRRGGGRRDAITTSSTAWRARRSRSSWPRWSERRRESRGARRLPSLRCRAADG